MKREGRREERQCGEEQAILTVSAEACIRGLIRWTLSSKCTRNIRLTVIKRKSGGGE